MIKYKYSKRLNTKQNFAYERNHLRYKGQGFPSCPGHPPQGKHAHRIERYQESKIRLQI